MATSPDDKCLTCDNSRKWHESSDQVVHSFNDGSLPTSATFGKRRADGTNQPASGLRGAAEAVQTGTASAWPFDPVLRQALIDKGLLTVNDLREAEDKIRQVTSIFEGKVPGGQ